MWNYLGFAFAWIGHGYLLMVTLNWLYAQPYHRKLLKSLRQVWALLLVGGPIVVGCVYGFDFSGFHKGPGGFFPPLGLYTYIGFATVAGLIAFPAVTIHRWLRRSPASVLKEQTTTIDIAKELGHRPVGDGKYRRVAGYAINDIFRVDFTRLELAIPGLPAAWDGMTILHLSDLHFYGTPSREYYEAVIRHCVKDEPPDFLVVSGDIIDDAKYLDWIEPILKPLQWKEAAFAILGNHDWWQDFDGVRERLSSLGMKVISNRWEAFTFRGETLVAIGHEGPWFRPAPDLQDCPPGFRLLVSHTPDNIRWARHRDCRLMLCGHNHGGQIRLPLIGSLFVPSRFSRKYDMGTFQEWQTVLHVNRGLSGKEPIRFRCNPQVSRITLRAVA